MNEGIRIISMTKISAEEWQRGMDKTIAFVRSRRESQPRQPTWSTRFDLPITEGPLRKGEYLHVAKEGNNE